MLTLILLIVYQCSALDNSLLLKNAHCNCLGETLTFECSVVGESYGITVWRGTALGKCEVQEISLRHDRFTEPTGARESCNNNSIVGQSLIVENGLYTSELNVTITSDNVGKTITCAYYNVTEITTVGLLNISLTDAEHGNFYHLAAQAQIDINVTTNITSDKLIIHWSKVELYCYTVQYRVLVLNCGNCPDHAYNTEAVCTKLPSNSNPCTIAIEAVICEDFMVANSSRNQYNLRRSSTFQRLPITGIVAGGTILVFIILLGIVITWLCVRKPRRASLRALAQSDRSNPTTLPTQVNDYGDHNFVKIFDNKATGIYSAVCANYEVNKDIDNEPTLRIFDNKANGIYSEKF